MEEENIAGIIYGKESMNRAFALVDAFVLCEDIFNRYL